MKTRSSQLALLSALIVFSSALTAQPNKKYPAPYPRDGVLKLGESDRVVAWEVLRQKGAASPMCQLPLDQIVVTLTEGAVKFTGPDGAARLSQEKFGSVRFESKGTIQQEEGLSDIPSRAIIFQLKEVPSRTLPEVKGIPGQFPRINAVKLFETDRINVWDQVWLPNQTLTNHLHYTQTVGVFLVGGKLQTRDLGKPTGAPFERHQGELLGVPLARPDSVPTEDRNGGRGSGVDGVAGRGGAGGGRGSAGGGPNPRMVPHEEEWAGGTPRAIWIEFK
jgi:hypothetical protein